MLNVKRCNITKNNQLTQDELKSKLKYDPESGIFNWIIKPSAKVMIGDIAGRKTMFGYIEITINKKIYKAHRLAWLYVNGIFPEDKIDHINCIKDDNRIINLRNSTNQQNQFNKNLTSINTSGHKNVTFNKKINKWQVFLSVNKRLKYFGSFDNIEFAALVAKEVRNKYHGEFVNHATT